MEKDKNLVVKTKSVNAYVNEKGHRFIRIVLENGYVTFINEGLVAYACQNASQVKSKQSK